jgi:hypothetical protein
LKSSNYSIQSLKNEDSKEEEKKEIAADPRSENKIKLVNSRRKNLIEESNLNKTSKKNLWDYLIE